MLPKRKPASFGPIPRPNSDAATPQARAASRWPNSWIIIARAANPMMETISDISLKRHHGQRRSTVNTHAVSKFRGFSRKFDERRYEVTKFVTANTPKTGG